VRSGAGFVAARERECPVLYPRMASGAQVLSSGPHSGSWDRVRPVAVAHYATLDCPVQRQAVQDLAVDLETSGWAVALDERGVTDPDWQRKPVDDVQQAACALLVTLVAHFRQAAPVQEAPSAHQRPPSTCRCGLCLHAPGLSAGGFAGRKQGPRGPQGDLASCMAHTTHTHIVCKLLRAP
jgi:hypothetical protein